MTSQQDWGLFFVLLDALALIHIVSLSVAIPRADTTPHISPCAATGRKRTVYTRV